MTTQPAPLVSAQDAFRPFWQFAARLTGRFNYSTRPNPDTEFVRAAPRHQGVPLETFYLNVASSAKRVANRMKTMRADPAFCRRVEGFMSSPQAHSTQATTTPGLSYLYFVASMFKPDRRDQFVSKFKYYDHYAELSTHATQFCLLIRDLAPLADGTDDERRCFAVLLESMRFDLAALGIVQANGYSPILYDYRYLVEHARSFFESATKGQDRLLTLMAEAVHQAVEEHVEDTNTRASIYQTMNRLIAAGYGEALAPHIEHLTKPITRSRDFQAIQNNVTPYQPVSADPALPARPLIEAWGDDIPAPKPPEPKPAPHVAEANASGPVVVSALAPEGQAVEQNTEAKVEPVQKKRKKDKDKFDVSCPKCGYTRGGDWFQCEDDCPMPQSPHYNSSREEEDTSNFAPGAPGLDLAVEE